MSATRRASPPTALVDRQRAAFLESGVSIVAASRSPDGVPAVSRATGCRVDADRRRVTVYLARSQAASLLESIAATRVVAVVFSRPTTHESVQLKGGDAEIRALGRGEAARIARYVQSFVSEVCPLGYEEAAIRALLWADRDDFVAVSFTVAAAFDQTPGPRAGSPLA